MISSGHLMDFFVALAQASACAIFSSSIRLNYYAKIILTTLAY